MLAGSEALNSNKGEDHLSPGQFADDAFPAQTAAECVEALVDNPPTDPNHRKKTGEQFLHAKAACAATGVSSCNVDACRLKRGAFITDGVRTARKHVVQEKRASAKWERSR